MENALLGGRLAVKKICGGVVGGLLFVIAGAIHANAECVNMTMGLSSMHQEQVVLVNDAGKRVTLPVFVADENYERASGFQNICQEVIEKVLILFRYETETFGRFHMQNVHAPLDIAFFDAGGRLIKTMLMEVYTEESKPLYDPGAPFQFALEARKGFFSDIGVFSTKSILILEP